jgi:hypothetical protein
VAPCLSLAPCLKLDCSLLALVYFLVFLYSGLGLLCHGVLRCVSDLVCIIGRNYLNPRALPHRRCAPGFEIGAQDFMWACAQPSRQQPRRHATRRVYGRRRPRKGTGSIVYLRKSDAPWGFRISEKPNTAKFALLRSNLPCPASRTAQRLQWRRMFGGRE